MSNVIDFESRVAAKEEVREKAIRTMHALYRAHTELSLAPHRCLETRSVLLAIEEAGRQLNKKGQVR